MTTCRRFFTLATAALFLVGSTSVRAGQNGAFAPNVVAITPRLVTSGQPSAAALAALGSQGFQAVIYLAPPTVPDAVGDEALIIGRQGLMFVNIPIKFDNPTAQDYEAFASTLAGLAGRKVLVHCQVNFRASSMTFLYRVIARKEDPRAAYEAVARVWVPDGQWKRFILTMLRKHGSDFEPY